eukprot:CAMPEP_0113592122 /NCGR_PEP_ID=MMETSP0015_2-20120614/37660_1 /TAXON_ID=2838 /ORGANISM="Odontella" /LENGTH=363 /DNA_ID=CAMNT_0000498601 /DNA_START=382 /DNA_END=1474 /DNA_ORIENTATION=+ /assembly_acc=CAM_ASM_000160
MSTTAVEQPGGGGGIAGAGIDDNAPGTTAAPQESSSESSSSSPAPATMEEASPPKVDKPESSALKSFLSGGVGGVCVVLVGHPLDLIKVRIQTASPSMQSSAVTLFRDTFRKEGVAGLYRGVSAPLVAVTPIFALSFWGYDIGKRTVKYLDEEGSGAGSNHVAVGGGGSPYAFSIPQLVAAGGLSAIPTTAIAAPSERIKCLLQVQANEIAAGGKARYGGMMEADGGHAEPVPGSFATLARDGPGSMAWFGVYELTKRELMRVQGIDPSAGQLSPSAILTAGGLAGMACWCVAIPPDVLKSRFQTAPEGKYNGMYDVYTHLMKEEGPSALFKGMRPALIRAFPANAACFFGMEVARNALSFMD